MSEIDERRIAELAKEPPRVLGRRGAASAAAREEARRVLEWQALIRGREPDVHGQGGGPC